MIFCLELTVRWPKNSLPRLHMAIRIRLVAAAHKVAIVERPPLARALYYNTDVGHEVPVEYFESVAEVLAFVYRLEGRAAS